MSEALQQLSESLVIIPSAACASEVGGRTITTSRRHRQTTGQSLDSQLIKTADVQYSIVSLRRAINTADVQYSIFPLRRAINTADVLYSIFPLRRAIKTEAPVRLFLEAFMKYLQDKEVCFSASFPFSVEIFTFLFEIMRNS